MMRDWINAKALGGACVAVGGGDTLLRLIDRTLQGEPLWLLGLMGAALLFSPTSRIIVRGTVLFAGLTLGWALVCLAVLLLANPPHFIQPVVLASYLAGSMLFAVWGWVLLKHMSLEVTPISRGKDAEKLGASLAHGVRRWLQ